MFAQTEREGVTSHEGVRSSSSKESKRWTSKTSEKVSLATTGLSGTASAGKLDTEVSMAAFEKEEDCLTATGLRGTASRGKGSPEISIAVSRMDDSIILEKKKHIEYV